MKKKFKILTLGCKANQYESQAYIDQLKTLGLAQAQVGEIADICIVNACAVTKNADKKSLHAIKSLKKQNTKARFFITGCIGSDIADDISANVKIIPNTQKHLLVNQIFPNRKIPKFLIKNFDNHTRAFIKVQDGCNSFCTFCIIPLKRGRSRSREVDDIIFEISGLVDNGYKEIVLTGINLGDYSSDISFAQLLKKIDQIKDLKRIKLSSINPEHITDEVIDILTSSDKMSRYLHISLQSGSDRILKKMNRAYDSNLFLQKIDKLTKKDPHFTFMTDVIVGFPSETDEDFEDTIKVVKKAQFTKVHVFPYSARPDTGASKFKEEVDKKIIDERKNRLSEIAKKIGFGRREKFIKREMKVLFENIKDDYFIGSTLNNLLVYVPKSEDIKSNEILDVKFVKNMDDYILGELCR
ncbi:MAG: Threonylcarbamoyladenosine tRNA methylthiotransferase MtaB [Candidatus Anoxychlamydiales bacterium]|nr:Threonylcarbamoyladenosine tRNA methylthiotransferase MtaB [Candidatus Anoxychlamydiales bacterium]